MTYFTRKDMQIIWGHFIHSKVYVTTFQIHCSLALYPSLLKLNTKQHTMSLPTNELKFYEVTLDLSEVFMVITTLFV